MYNFRIEQQNKSQQLNSASNFYMIVIWHSWFALQFIPQGVYLSLSNAHILVKEIYK